MAGLEPEEQFLEHAMPFYKSGCVAHYTVGLRALATGDRKKAREHFVAASRMGGMGWWCYRCSKAFLAQMNTDPEWPRWIPLNDSVESSD